MIESFRMFLARLEELDLATMETWAEQCGEHPSTRGRNAAFLQIILQDAIDARKCGQWRWTVNSFCQAYICVANPGRVPRVYFESGSTPVEALLKAYIKALEAEREGGR